jgi:hypothetical protein
VAALLQIQKSILKGNQIQKNVPKGEPNIKGKRTKSHKIPIKPYQVIESKQKINLRESLSKRTFNFKQ